MSDALWKYDYSKNKINNSIAIGIILCANALSPILSLIPNGIVAIIFIPLIYLIIYNRNYYLSQNFNAKSFICFVLFIFIFFGYSFCIGALRHSIIESYFNFLIFGIPLILISYLRIGVIYFFRTIVIVGIIALPLQLTQIDISNTSDSGLWMSVSYNLIKIIIPSIIVLFYDRIKIIKIIGICQLLAGIAFLLVLGSRGAVLGVFLSVLLLLLYRNNKKLRILSFKSLLVAFSFIAIILFFEPIITFVYEKLQDQNIPSYSLMRIVNSLNEGSSLSSGRDDIYAVAISGIKNNLILGSGIGSFDNYSGAYPHNIFLQILYEGGLLFGIPLIAIIILAISMLNQETTMDKRLLYIYLISAGLVQLLFSANFWSSILFWYWIGLTIKRIQL